jgi:transposase
MTARTKKTLYCGIDLHSNNAMYVVTDQTDKVVFKKRMPNELPVILSALKPFKSNLVTVAVESTYNWYWLVDGLIEQGYPVVLANPAAIDQYDGIKDSNDLTDAAFLAHLARLGILPTGYIYPKEERPVRDLLRRRTLIVRQRTAIILSLQNMFMRQAALNMNWRKIRKLTPEQRADVLGDNEYLLFVTESQVDLIEVLNEKIIQFEKKVLEHAKLKPEFELLLSIPGVGLILGLTIMLETGAIDRFKKVGNFTSYCRCVRANKQSNGKSKGSNNSKNGNPHLAWAFVEVVHHAIRRSPQAKKFYDRKKSKRNGALATKALGAKWSKGAYYVMKRQEPFDLKRLFS